MCAAAFHRPQLVEHIDFPEDMKIAFLAAETEEAQNAVSELREIYGHHRARDSDVIVAVGGDGLMLESLHAALDGTVRSKPVFGMNRGSVGFLLNHYSTENLVERIRAATAIPLHPLRMHARDTNGKLHEALAINEVSLLRETRQAAKINIAIDSINRLGELICDGIMVATPAGSTAYNLSVGGPILPLESRMLALTPISAFRPRRWRGALLPSRTHIRFEVLEETKRPVSAVADYTEVRDVKRVDIMEARDVTLRLLFDPEHNLEERILKEQFLP